MKSGKSSSIQLPPIGNKNILSTPMTKKSKFGGGRGGVNKTVELLKKSQRMRRGGSPKVKKVIRQTFINKFKDKFSMGNTKNTSKVTSLFSIKTKGGPNSDRDKITDVYQKIDVLYFPTESGSNSNQRQFLSYNAIINSEEYFKNTRGILTPPKEKERRRMMEEQKEDSDPRNSRENSPRLVYIPTKKSIDKMSLRLDFNRSKSQSYLKSMKTKTIKSYRNAIREIRTLDKDNIQNTVKVMKRMPLASLESIRDKMITKKIRKEKKKIEESSLMGAPALKKAAKNPMKRLKGDELEALYDPEIKLPSREIREKHVKSYPMAYYDTNGEYVTKNFDSTEGIGYCYYKGRCYFFGGIGRPYDRSVYFFSTKNQIFSTANINTQSSPFGRCYHSMAAKDAQIVMFGGESSSTGLGSRYLINETWILDLKHRVWEKISDYDNDIIEPRKSHAVCFIGKNMIVSGGLGEDDKALDDFLCFDLDRKTWSPVLTKIDGFKGISCHTMVACYTKRVKDIYSKPVKSGNHTGPKIAFEGIYVFGGKDDSGRPVNDLYIINTAVKPWKRVRVAPIGIPPRPRYGHCSHFMKETGHMVVYGGRNIEMYKIGNTTCFNDIFILDLTYLTWNNVHVISGKSIDRFNFCSYVHNQKLFIMGGMNDANYLDYNPSILEYNPELAKRVRMHNKNIKKKMKSAIKKMKKEKLKTEDSDYEYNAINGQERHLSPVSEVKEEKKSYEFDEESSDEEEVMPLPKDRVKNIKLKNEQNFVSFMPLPDSFHTIVTMAEFVKKIGDDELGFDRKEYPQKVFKV